MIIDESSQGLCSDEWSVETRGFCCTKCICCKWKGSGWSLGIKQCSLASIRSGFSVRPCLRSLKPLFDAWARNWHRHRESSCGRTRFGWIYSNLCLKQNCKGFELLLPWLCYLHKHNIINMSFIPSYSMWLVIAVTQKSYLNRKCVICIFFYLKLHITHTANCTSELFTLCQKGNNSIALLEQFDEFPTMFTLMSVILMFSWHVQLLGKQNIFRIIYFLQNLTKNYIHRNPACPQRKEKPWLAPTDLCLKRFLPNDWSGATENK